MGAGTGGGFHGDGRVHGQVDLRRGRVVGGNGKRNRGDDVSGGRADQGYGFVTFGVHIVAGGYR